MSERINSFRDLRVHHEACALDLAIFGATKSFPRDEMFSLTDQVRRSSRSVGANISETWAKCRYPAHFVRKLTDADGELQETRHWIGRAQAYGYLAADGFADFDAKCAHVGRMLGKMIQSPEDFT
ncbi:MAG: four helix bundle protein [Undibacterium sp.]|nr:four helix bundle protein [Opitutaceae bacterium]